MTCKHHGEAPRTKQNKCRLCKAASDKAYRAKNRDKLIASTANWHKTNRAHIQQYYRTKLYGLSKEQYEALLVSQNYKCAICKTADAKEIDHCHTTGKVRGILCGPCNRGIGIFKENRTTIAAVLAYLGDK